MTYKGIILMVCDLRVPPETAPPSFEKGNFVNDGPLPVARPRPFSTEKGLSVFNSERSNYNEQMAQG
jgi:hypothetical protein